MRLSIPFSEIPEQGVQLEITDRSWFPDHFAQGAGPFAASIQLTRKQDNKIELQGSLETSIKLTCDRCLQEYGHRIVSHLQILVEMPGTERHWRLQDVEIKEEELDTIEVDEPVVELGDILRQQVLLSLPEKKLCFEACKGLCPHCGINLNEAQCSCVREPARSPFAALALLKKNK